jgi:hypothetical protein
LNWPGGRQEKGFQVGIVVGLPSSLNSTQLISTLVTSGDIKRCIRHDDRIKGESKKDYKQDSASPWSLVENEKETVGEEKRGS